MARFRNFEAETNPEVREIISKLIHGELNEEDVIDQWIKINKYLYVGWNPKSHTIKVATKSRDVKNEHIFKFVVQNLYTKLPGGQGKPKFDRTRGNELGIKYVGRSQCLFASWKVNPKNFQAHA